MKLLVVIVLLLDYLLFFFSLMVYCLLFLEIFGIFLVVVGISWFFLFNWYNFLKILDCVLILVLFCVKIEFIELIFEFFIKFKIFFEILVFLVVFLFIFVFVVVL